MSLADLALVSGCLDTCATQTTCIIVCYTDVMIYETVFLTESLVSVNREDEGAIAVLCKCRYYLKV